MRNAARKNMVMSKTELNAFVDEPGWEAAQEHIQELSSRVFAATADYIAAHEDFDFMQTGKTLSINLSLSNDAEVQKLNAEFRHLDKPTNVLSFANIDDECFDDMVAESDVIELGDIIIALETMQKEAALKNISLHDHYCHLLIHGILHLMGFDHQDDAEAEYMENHEIRILALLNVPNPYQE